MTTRKRPLKPATLTTSKRKKKKRQIFSAAVLRAADVEDQKDPRTRIAIVRSWAPRARVIPDPVLAEQVEVYSRIRTPSLPLKRRALRVARQHHVTFPGPPARKARPHPVGHLKVGVRRATRLATMEQDRRQRNRARRNPARRAQLPVALLVRALPNALVEQPEKARGNLLVPARGLHEKALHEKALHEKAPYEKAPHERALAEKRQHRAAGRGARDEARPPVAERLERHRDNRLAVGPQRKAVRDAPPVDGPHHAPAGAHRAAVAAAKSKQRELRSLWPT